MGQFAVNNFTIHTHDIEELYIWIFERIRTYLFDRVFEINSEKGLLSSMIMNLGLKMQLNATSEPDYAFLQEKFKNEPLVRGIHMIDFRNSELGRSYRHFQNQFSTVIALNNIQNEPFYDQKTIDKAKRFLQSDGHIIVFGRPTTWFLPGSEDDIALLRKHNKGVIEHILTDCEIVKTRFFDYNGPCYLAIGRKH